MRFLGSDLWLIGLWTAVILASAELLSGGRPRLRSYFQLHTRDVKDFRGALQFTSAALIFVVGLVLFLSSVTFQNQVLHDSFPISLGSALVLATLIPFIEEVFFRGAMTDFLGRFLRPEAAMLSSALVFGLFHADGLVHVAATAMAGLFWSELRRMTGGLWFGVLGHVFTNSLVAIASNYTGTQAGPALSNSPDPRFALFFLGIIVMWVARKPLLITISSLHPLNQAKESPTLAPGAQLSTPSGLRDPAR